MRYGRDTIKYKLKQCIIFHDPSVCEQEESLFCYFLENPSISTNILLTWQVFYQHIHAAGVPPQKMWLLQACKTLDVFPSPAALVGHVTSRALKSGHLLWKIPPSRAECSQSRSSIWIFLQVEDVCSPLFKGGLAVVTFRRELGLVKAVTFGTKSLWKL